MKAPGSGLLLAVALAAAVGGEPPPATTSALDLVLPGSKQRLRWQFAVDGTAPEAAWTAFLDRWFDFFDRNGDGLLDRAEAARLFALPLPDQGNVAFAFDKADADRNGHITRAELKTFYRSAGFVPVLAVVEPPTLRDIQVAEALFRHFGPDAGGRLTAATLARAGDVLRKLDENEDEALTPAEVLSLGSTVRTAPARSDCRWAPPAGKAAGTVRLTLERRGGTLRVAVVGKALQVLPGNGHHLRFGDAVLAISPECRDADRAVAVSRQFVLTQFGNLAGSKQAVEKRQVEDDASLQLLADLFPHADRDGDGKLTRAELERFLALLVEGVRCCVVVTLADGGRNLFALLDTNGDGQLDLSELQAAPGLLSKQGGPQGWLPSDVPLHLRLTVQQGFTGSAFGPLPLIAPPTVARPSAGRAERGPAWFRSMDRNGDGLVSRAEFLGPSALFQRLDRNGDGSISVEEAERAEAERQRVK